MEPGGYRNERDESGDWDSGGAGLRIVRRRPFRLHERAVRIGCHGASGSDSAFHPEPHAFDSQPRTFDPKPSALDTQPDAFEPTLRRTSPLQNR